MTLKVVKLINGDEIIADIDLEKDSTKETYTLHDSLASKSYWDGSDFVLYFVRYCATTDDPIEIRKTDILFLVDPIKDVVTNFEEFREQRRKKKKKASDRDDALDVFKNMLYDEPFLLRVQLGIYDIICLLRILYFLN